LAQQFEDSIWLQPVDAVSERGGCTLPGKTFIWLPFAGGISAFAVILPKPMEPAMGSVAVIRTRPT
jgi:hypothetical protein